MKKTCTGLVLLLCCFSKILSQEAEPTEGLLKWYQDHYCYFNIKDTVFTFESEFEFPDGYTRVSSRDLSNFAGWISHIPLWGKGKSVGSLTGIGKAFEYDQICRVVHLSWKGLYFTSGTIPIQLMAEYYRCLDRESDMAILPAKGKRFTYGEYLTGRPAYRAGGELFIKPGKQRQASLKEFYEFLHVCMKNTTFASLEADCDSVSVDQVGPGDLYIAYDEKGTSGVTYVILNKLVSEDEPPLFAIATGCARSCDFHIPKVNARRENPWLTAERIVELAGQWPHSGFFRLLIK